MSNPTTPFGWQMPTNTDLVTDLPADFEVFGQAVATSMADLLGGTTGQILAKTSATDMDFTWTTPNAGDITGVTAGTGISGGGTSGTVTVTNDMATTITAAGDIVVGTGSGTYDNLPIGTTNQILTADTTVSPYKVKWATPATPSSGATLITRTTFSASAAVTVDSLFSSTYENYLVSIQAFGSVQNVQLQLRGRYGSTTHSGLNYQFGFAGVNTSDATFRTSFNYDQAQWNLVNLAGTNGIMNFTFYRPNASAHLQFSGISRSQYTGNCLSGAAFVESNQSWTGLYLFPASGTITGQISVYGLAAA